jgi:hypothetical protein
METETAPVAEPTLRPKKSKRTSTLEIPWQEIEECLRAGERVTDLAKLYKLAPSTIRAHCSRNKMPCNRRMVKTISKEMEQVVRAAAEEAAKSWLEKGEEHRKVAFDIAHESVSKFKARAPRNFRELEAADKIARRAAGLEVADVVQQTLVNVNEAIDSFEMPQEATVIEAPAADEPALPAASASEPVEVALEAVESTL